MSDQGPWGRRDGIDPQPYTPAPKPVQPKKARNGQVTLVVSTLLMVGFLAQSGIVLEPLQLSVWAIPTAIAAFLIHGARLVLFGRRQRAAAGEDEA